MKWLPFFILRGADFLEEALGKTGATAFVAMLFLMVIGGVIFVTLRLRRTPEGLTEALISAAVNNRLRSARKAISQGANVNARSEDGCTPLMLASFNGHQEMVELLLQHGASINAIDRDCKTALVYANEQNRAAVADLLIRNGALTSSSEKRFQRNYMVNPGTPERPTV